MGSAGDISLQILSTENIVPLPIHCVKEDVGSKNFQKWFFKLRIEPGKNPESFTMAFNKTVYTYTHDDYPNQDLVLFEDDDSAVNPKYSLGNLRGLENRITVLSHC